MTDWLSKHSWVILLPKANACIFHNSVMASYFNFYVIYTFKSSGFNYHMQYIHKEYDFVFIWRMFDSHRFIRFSPFWFINPLEYLPVQVSFRLLLWAGNTYIHIMFLPNYLFINFQGKCSKCFLEIISLYFCLVNSECDAYLPIDRSLV